MGRPIIAQKRGKGGMAYRVPNYHFKPVIEYKNQTGVVVDLVHHKIRNAPLYYGARSLQLNVPAEDSWVDVKWMAENTTVKVKK